MKLKKRKELTKDQARRLGRIINGSATGVGQRSFIVGRLEAEFKGHNWKRLCGGNQEAM